MAFMLTAGESNDLDQAVCGIGSMPVDLSDLMKAGSELFACQLHGLVGAARCVFVSAAYCVRHSVD